MKCRPEICNKIREVAVQAVRIGKLQENTRFLKLWNSDEFLRVKGENGVIIYLIRLGIFCYYHS